MTELTPEVIHRLPKTDLHVHLDGSLRIPTLIELAKERQVKLPSYTVEGLRELVFKDSYKNLPEYLEGFLYTTAVMSDAEAIERIAYELQVIKHMGFASSFLIVWDLMQFCKAEGILAQGRGSAANSAVCYSLGITAVDPVGMELLFERFLSEERGEWPDIDIDLPSGDRREKVIQHVYTKYGPHGAAMTANVITYREKSAAREIGKVLDLPDDVVENVSRQMRRFEWHDTKDTFDARLERAWVDRGDLRVAELGHDARLCPSYLRFAGRLLFAGAQRDNPRKEDCETRHRLRDDRPR